METRAATLRRAQQVNAGFSGSCGLVLVVAARPLGALVGVGRWVLFGVGLMLLLFGVTLWRSASRPHPDPTEALIVIWADVAWVLGSVVVLVIDPLTSAGAVIIGVVAGIVLGFAIWQYVGFRRLRAPPPPTVSVP